LRFECASQAPDSRQTEDSMCRWIAYRGEPIPLEHYVTAPAHSLVEQSIRALESTAATNGDGFGLGWYGEHTEPGLYREVRPAWSDLAIKARSEEHTSELQSLTNLVCRLLLAKKKTLTRPHPGHVLS